MSKVKLIQLSVILLALIFILSACNTGGLDPKTTYYITVTVSVLDATSQQPVLNANVSTIDGKSGSGSDGVFTFNLTGETTYTFVAIAPNYGEARQQVSTGRENMSITIKMSQKKGSISGTIVDDLNTPIPDATVNLVELGRNTQSDSSGVFTFADVPVTDTGYSLTVSKTGFGERTFSNIKVTADQPTKDLGKIVMSNVPGSLTGKVLNSSDQPIENVTVNIIELAQTTTTDYNGTYSMSVLPGTYTVEFTHPDFEKITKNTVTIERAKGTSLNVKMVAKPGSLTGIVVDNGGSPVMDVQVTILGLSGAQKTLSNGFFKFESVAPGSYTLQFDHPSFKSYNMTAIVESGKETTLGNITITEKVGILTGRVLDLDQSTGISNATIRVLELGTSCNTNSDGYFTFSNIRIGTYTIEATATSYSTVDIPNTQIKENLITTMTDIKLFKNPGVIVGTVKDRVTGQDLVGTSVTIIETGAKTTTDSSGVFKFNTRAGTYSLKFEYLNYVTNNQTNIYCGPNTTNNIGIIYLDPNPGQINGTTTPGATVQLRETGASVTANSTGAFTLNNVVEGTYNLDVSLNNYNSRTISVTVAPGQVVQVGDCTLTAIPGRIVGSSNASSVMIVQTGVTASVSNSMFTIENVAPGNYTLRYTRNNYLTQDINITVNPNATTDAGTVTLKGMAGIIRGYITNPSCNVFLVELNQSQFYNNASYFQFTNVDPGTYHIKIERTGYRTYVNTVEVPAGETVDLGSLTINTAYNFTPTAYDNLTAREAAGDYVTSYFTLNYPQTVTLTYWSTYGGMISFSKQVLALKGPSGDIRDYRSFSYNDGPVYTTENISLAAGNYSIYTQSGDYLHMSIAYKSDTGYPEIIFDKTYGIPSTSHSVKITSSDYTGVNLQYSWSESSTTPGTYASISSGQTITNSLPGVWYLHTRATDGAGHVSTRMEGPYIITDTGLASVSNKVLNSIFNPLKSYETNSPTETSYAFNFDENPKQFSDMPNQKSLIAANNQSQPISEAAIFGALLSSIGMTLRKRKQFKMR